MNLTRLGSVSSRVVPVKGTARRPCAEGRARPRRRSGALWLVGWDVALGATNPVLLAAAALGYTPAVRSSSSSTPASRRRSNLHRVRAGPTRSEKTRPRTDLTDSSGCVPGSNAGRDGGGDLGDRGACLVGVETHVLAQHLPGVQGRWRQTSLASSCRRCDSEAGASCGANPLATQAHASSRIYMVSLPEFCVLEQLSLTARRALGARPICPERSVQLTSVPQLNPGVSWTWATSPRRRLAGRIATDTGRGPRSSWRCVRAEGRAGNTAPVAGWPWWVAVTWRSPFSV